MNVGGFAKARIKASMDAKANTRERKDKYAKKFVPHVCDDTCKLGPKHKQ